MKDKNRLWILFARKLAGEATSDELKELESLINENPDVFYSIEVISDWWKISRQEEATSDESRVARLFRQIKRNEKRATGKIFQEEKRKTSSLPYLLKDSLMFKNYFKIAWRNMVRGKGFSLVNITGLAIGMASAILILLWIQNELSFDRFHKNEDRIYQAYSRGTFDGKTEAWAGTSMLMAPTLELNYPEVQATARVNQVSAFIFHVGEKHLPASGLLTDGGFLKIFDFPALLGDIRTALNSERSLVITKTFAEKLFGNADPIGKMVRIDSSSNFMVTAVLKDLPNNTRFYFDYLIPWSYMKEVHWDRPYWANADINTYILLKPGVNEETVNAHIANIVKSHSADSQAEIFLHPLSKWRLWSEFENGRAVGGFIKAVRLFAIIAGLILLIACINYMNLATARSIKRAREVGVRKVVGAGRRGLIKQFLAESILVSVAAGIIAIVIAQPSLGWFNNLTQKKLFIPYGNPYFWLYSIGFILFTGILAGSYPAFYLSAQKPIQVLKGTFKAVNALITPRKVMVVLQFTFAIAFIICTIVIHKQIKYGQGRDFGFAENNLIYTYLKGDLQKNYRVISAELLSSGAITSITRTNSPITTVWNGDDSYEWKGKNPGSEVGIDVFHTDKDFAKTMGLKIIAGRDIDAEKYPTDSNAVILNEAAAKTMGFKDPIGQLLKSQEGNWQVIGVVKDFITGSPFAATRPTVVQGPGKDHWYGTVTFKLNPGNTTSSSLEKIGAILTKYNPDYPFDYYFADEAHAIKFEQEKKTESLSVVFAALTIFISCLGLFALAAYMAENRTKEIGVRKVLGASVSSISALLSKDFLKLVIIAFVIASPLAWWVMHSWLEDYSYRVNIGWTVFALTGFISILIAVLTVSFQAIKAAIANPVKSLRTE